MRREVNEGVTAKSLYTVPLDPGGGVNLEKRDFIDMI